MQDVYLLICLVSNNIQKNDSFMSQTSPLLMRPIQCSHMEKSH